MGMQHVVPRSPQRSSAITITPATRRGIAPMWVNTASAISIWLADELVVAVPHPLVVAAGVAELLVGDEQDGAAFGGQQQVGGQRLAGCSGAPGRPLLIIWDPSARPRRHTPARPPRRGRRR